MTNAAGKSWGCRQVPVSEGGCSEMRRGRGVVPLSPFRTKCNAAKQTSTSALLSCLRNGDVNRFFV